MPLSMLITCDPKTVDDLKEGRGAEYVDKSQMVLIFVSDGYFESQNCMRELLRAVFDEKPIIALTETDAKHGGLTRDEVRVQLEATVAHLNTNWKLADELREWGMALPTVAHLCDALFDAMQVEWNRIGFFRNLSRRSNCTARIAAPIKEMCSYMSMCLHGCLSVFIRVCFHVCSVGAQRM